MTTTLAATRRMHVSLDVDDLERSVAFYRALFDREPAKRFDDYAKFVLEDPALVFSLNPVGGPRSETRLSHLGIQLAPGQLEEVDARLRAAGLVPRPEDEVTCCYAVQNKRWVVDPDGNSWELYEVLADAPVHSVKAEDGSSCCSVGNGCAG